MKAMNTAIKQQCLGGLSTEWFLILQHQLSRTIFNLVIDHSLDSYWEYFEAVCVKYHSLLFTRLKVYRHCS